MSIKVFILPTKHQTNCMFRPQSITEIFTGHADNHKCNIWGLEAAAILRRVKAQHIKGIAKILADLVSRLKAVGIYHDIDSNDHQQELSTPFEPLTLVEGVTHTALEVNQVVITPNIERLRQAYDTLHSPPTAQTGDDIKLSLKNVLPTDMS